MLRGEKSKKDFWAKITEITLSSRRIFITALAVSLAKSGFAARANSSLMAFIPVIKNDKIPRDRKKFLEYLALLAANALFISLFYIIRFYFVSVASQRVFYSNFNEYLEMDYEKFYSAGRCLQNASNSDSLFRNKSSSYSKRGNKNVALNIHSKALVKSAEIMIFDIISNIIDLTVSLCYFRCTKKLYLYSTLLIASATVSILYIFIFKIKDRINIAKEEIRNIIFKILNNYALFRTSGCLRLFYRIRRGYNNSLFLAFPAALSAGDSIYWILGHSLSLFLYVSCPEVHSNAALFSVNFLITMGTILRLLKAFYKLLEEYHRLPVQSSSYNSNVVNNDNANNDNANNDNANNDNQNRKEKFDQIIARNCNIYINGKLVLHDVCFSFNKPGFVAVIGDNGSGKSVLARFIMGLLKYDGYFEKNTNISYLSQNMSQTITQEAPGVKLKKNSLVSSNNSMNYDEEHVERLLDGKKEDVKEIIKELKIAPSMGYFSQMINLANAILREKAVLVLDESLNYFSVEAGNRILRYLKKNRKNQLIFLILHGYYE
ncbi:hypothetical protein ENBRE01_2445, partial [Enteropsectra breve]